MYAGTTFHKQRQSHSVTMLQFQVFACILIFRQNVFDLISESSCSVATVIKQNPDLHEDDEIEPGAYLWTETM